jgi:CRISPR-associated protein Csm4
VRTFCITIEPLGFFGTPLKGDTIFGCFCWQAVYEDRLLFIPFKEAVTAYVNKPFAVFSSAFPLLNDGQGYAFKRPDVPFDYLFDFADADISKRILERKKNDHKYWWINKTAENSSSLMSCKYMTGQELAAIALPPGEEERTNRYSHKISSFSVQYHNTINRLTGTTGEDAFAPYGSLNYCYAPGTRLAIFVGIDENVTGIDEVSEGMGKIGASGFGRDASTGMGKFKVVECKEIQLASLGCDNPNALYTLAPCVPERGAFEKSYFSMFTRFGCHGESLAKSRNPFKNPVIMADEGAVFKPHDMGATLQRPYIGRGIGAISLAEPATIHQGYSLYIPVYLEAQDE